MAKPIVTATPFPRSRSGRRQSGSDRQSPPYDLFHDFERTRGPEQWTWHRVLRQDTEWTESERCGNRLRLRNPPVLEHERRAFDLAQYHAQKHRLPFRVGHSPYIRGQPIPLLTNLTLPGTAAPPVVLKSATIIQLLRYVLNCRLEAGFSILPIIDKDLWIERIAHETFAVCLMDNHPSPSSRNCPPDNCTTKPSFGSLGGFTLFFTTRSPSTCAPSKSPRIAFTRPIPLPKRLIQSPKSIHIAPSGGSLNKKPAHNLRKCEKSSRSGSARISFC